MHRTLCIVSPIAGTINASSGSLATLRGGTPKDRHSSKSRGCYSYGASTRASTLSVVRRRGSRAGGRVLAHDDTGHTRVGSRSESRWYRGTWEAITVF